VLVVSLKAGGSSDPAAVQSLLPTDTPQHTVTGTTIFSVAFLQFFSRSLFSSTVLVLPG
jgi:hypothetical protein